MGANKNQGYEEVDVDGVSYLFKADFAFLQVLTSLTNQDPSEIFGLFSSHKMPPDLIHKVLVSAFVSKEGVELTGLKAEQECIDIINLKGLQEGWALAQILLTYAMVGDIKKSELRTLAQTEKWLERLTPFRSESLKNLLYLWAWHLMISGVSVCISFKLFVMHMS